MYSVPPPCVTHPTRAEHSPLQSSLARRRSAAAATTRRIGARPSRHSTHCLACTCCLAEAHFLTVPLRAPPPSSLPMIRARPSPVLQHTCTCMLYARLPFCWQPQLSPSLEQRPSCLPPPPPEATNTLLRAVAVLPAAAAAWHLPLYASLQRPLYPYATSAPVTARPCLRVETAS
jgi:hypothetical protein